MEKFNKKDLENIFKELNLPSLYFELKDEIYGVYEVIYNESNSLIHNLNNINFVPVNPIVVVFYIISEIKYYFDKNQKKEIEEYKKMFEDEKFNTFLCSIVCDKYLTNEQLNYKSNAFLNRFSPIISTLNLMLNFSLKILTEAKLKLNKYESLVKDMLKNSFSLAKCITSLLISGFDVEAFSTWRTMHENEAILIVLIKNGQDTFDSYFNHIKYSLAYRGQIKNKEKVDEIFLEIKSNMKKYDLKSKDMKKYIEYGYLFSIKNITLNQDFKLNFRDGVENLAGLKTYSKTYELSSEIAHSSPLLIYSNREFYHLITLLNLYDSFFRLEKIFSSFYKKHFKKEEVATFAQYENIYMSELLLLYKDLNSEFKRKYGSNIKAEHLDNKNLQ